MTGKLFFLFALAFTFKSNAQQLVRASGNLQIVTTAGTKTVIHGGGITFLGTSKWTATDDSIYLIKTSAADPEGWLDSTTAGAIDPASTGTVFMKGSNRQSFYGNTKFYNLTIRNTVGDTLLSSSQVRNNLRLDTGFVFTKTGYGNDSLLVSSTAINAISSSSNFSRSWVNGRLSRTGNVIGTPAADFYLFPVGKTDSLYAPIKLAKVDGTTATWTAEYTYAAPFDRTHIFNPPIDHISELEYWEISSDKQAGTDDDARLSLSWRGQSRVNANPIIRDSLIVAQYINNPPFVWNVPGNWVTGNTVGADSLFGYVTSNAPTNNYSYDERRFTLGTISKYNALPVKLLYFTAIADAIKVRLNWEAANEQDTRKYEIEKSLGTTDFSFMSLVNARQLSQSGYVDDDRSPSMGWNYYRLKVIDKNGAYFYSPVRAVKFDKGLEQVKLFPVPASTLLNIQLPGSYVNQTVLQVIGADGKLITTLKPAASMIILNVRPLEGGAYFIQVTKSNGIQESYGFVKQ